MSDSISRKVRLVGTLTKWLIISTFLLPFFVFSEKSPKKFDAIFEAWRSKYGQKIDIKLWNKQNPKPYTSYFSSTSEKCTKNWHISLGPIGVSTLMHDRSWVDLFPACKSIAPEVLSDDLGLVYNAYEVTVVKPNSPADGILKVGDLILEMDGYRMREAQLTYLGEPLGNKDCRGLEIFAGQVIDRAEGRGKITLTVLRIPEKKQSKLKNALKGTRQWREIQNVDSDFEVMLNNADLFRLSTKKGTKVNSLTLSNSSGKSFPVSSSGKRGGSLINSQLVVPSGNWLLKGNISVKKNSSVKIETLTTPDYPESFKPYLKTVELKLPKIGSFGSDFNPNSEKARNYSKMLAHRLAIQQNEDGSWLAKSYGTPAFYTAICGVALMSTNDQQYSDNIRKAAYYVANGPWDKWTYTYGMRLTFLAEYYLRTKDKGILPGLKLHLAESRQYILADYTAGHGNSPGYGGSGYIGGGGMLACGLAVASHTPAASAEDKIILDKMLERVQEISPSGKVPYGRAYSGDVTEPASGQGGSCGTGPYFFASLIRGGANHFVRTAAKRYGRGPWGTAENGHATQTLHFVWGVLASANCGSKAFKGCMDSYLWKFTVLREFDGFVNNNNYRTEYHNGDGVIGPPYWRTAGYLLIMNAHKKNLAITGSTKYRAKTFKKSPIIFHRDISVYNMIKRNWYLVEAKLGRHAPGSFVKSVTQLENMKKDENLGVNLRKFLKSQGVAVVRELCKSKPVGYQQLSELILGISFEASCSPNIEVDMDDVSSGLKDESSSSGKVDKKAAKKASKDYQKKLKKQLASGKDFDLEHILHIRPYSLVQKEVNAGKSTDSYSTCLYDFSDIKISISDPTKNYLKNPISFSPNAGSSLKRKKGDMNDTLNHRIVINTAESTNFNVFVSYSIEGIKMAYTTKMPVPAKEARSYVPNLNIVKVKGTVSEDYRGVWTCRVKLSTGRIIGCEQWYHPTDYILSGTPCEFGISPTGRWAHNIRYVRKLEPSFGIAKPSAVSVSSKFTGDLKSLFDADNKTSLSINDSGKCKITYSYAKPVKIASRFINAENKGKKVGKINTVIEAFVDNGWQVIRKATVSSFSPTLTIASTKFRITLDVPNGGLDIKELTLNLASNQRSSKTVEKELSW